MFPNQEPSWSATPAGCLTEFKVSIAIAEAPIQEAQGTPLLRVDQDPGEEVGQRLVAVQREHVRDVLVGADDDHAARSRG